MNWVPLGSWFDWLTTSDSDPVRPEALEGRTGQWEGFSKSVCDMSLRGASATKQSPIPRLLRGVYPERSRRARNDKGRLLTHSKHPAGHNGRPLCFNALLCEDRPGDLHCRAGGEVSAVQGQLDEHFHDFGGGHSNAQRSADAAANLPVIPAQNGH